MMMGVEKICVVDAGGTGGGRVIGWGGTAIWKKRWMLGGEGGIMTGVGSTLVELMR